MTLKTVERKEQWNARKQAFFNQHAPFTADLKTYIPANSQGDSCQACGKKLKHKHYIFSKNRGFIVGSECVKTLLPEAASETFKLLSTPTKQAWLEESLPTLRNLLNQLFQNTLNPYSEGLGYTVKLRPMPPKKLYGVITVTAKEEDAQGYLDVEITHWDANKGWTKSLAQCQLNLSSLLEVVLDSLTH